MSVKVRDKATKQETVGKFALVKEGQVNLYSGIMVDKKGNWRGCGKRTPFPVDNVDVSADDPHKELKKEE